jgi:hypothetical protein
VDTINKLYTGTEHPRDWFHLSQCIPRRHNFVQCRLQSLAGKRKRNSYYVPICVLLLPVTPPGPMNTICYDSFDSYNLLFDSIKYSIMPVAICYLWSLYTD